MSTHRAAPGFYRRHGKRLFDLALLILLAIPSAFAGVAVAALVHWRMGAPVIFRQERPGRDGRPFTMYKFRTMIDAYDADGNPLPDAQRLTRLGRLLRSTSLDELPELMNVLKGDMSFSGPRPLLMKYLELYTPQQARRHEARPGITGWAQVNGRNALSWERKFQHDVWYVDNMSFSLDLAILFRTIAQVLTRSDISQPGSATAAEFRGALDE